MCVEEQKRKIYRCEKQNGTKSCYLMCLSQLQMLLKVRNDQTHLQELQIQIIFSWMQPLKSGM